MNKLDSAGGQLTSGIDKLATGSDTLTKGLKTFNDDGISKLSDLAGDDLDSVINHFKAVKKADIALNGITVVSGINGCV